jgi:hypothetical protein
MTTAAPSRDGDHFRLGTFATNCASSTTLSCVDHGEDFPYSRDTVPALPAEAGIRPPLPDRSLAAA